MQKYLTAAAAMAIACVSTTSADAAQTIHITGTFNDLISGTADLGATPLPVDLTIVLYEADTLGGFQYDYYASSFSGTAGSVSFTGDVGNSVLTIYPTYSNALRIFTQLTLSNGYTSNFGLEFFGATPYASVDQAFFDGAHMGGSGMLFSSPSTPNVGDYDNFKVTSVSVTGDAVPVVYIGGSGVPEPASWMMMIAGFGVAGAAMRRRVSRRVTFA